jgi:hypothetical protein
VGINAAWAYSKPGYLLHLPALRRNDVSSGFFAQIQRHSAFIAESVLLSGCVWGKVRCHALFLLWVNCVLEPILRLVTKSDSGTEAGMTLVPAFLLKSNVIPHLLRNLSCLVVVCVGKYVAMLCFCCGLTAF